MRNAVIVETRFNPDLPQIIRDHFRFLTGDWQLVVFGSKANMEQIIYSFPDCIFYDLGYSEISFDFYNSLLRNPDFWLKIPDEDVLIFQYDSMLLKTGIEKFFEWDYVGSPWIQPEWGGNGGLSIRKRSIMLACLAVQPNVINWNNEDGFFCDIMINRGIGILAPREVCFEFSCETIFKMGTYGYHKANGYMTKEQFELIREQYRTVNIIGTGRSIFNLKSIEPGLVLTLGMAIKEIEKLDLPNEIVSMEKDGCTEHPNECDSKDCHHCPYGSVYPQKARLLLHELESYECMPDYPKREFWNNERDFGLIWRTESVLSAIELMLKWGYEKFNFYCFDAVTNGNTENCYMDGSYGGYQSQAERLKERVQTLDHKFIQP